MFTAVRLFPLIVTILLFNFWSFSAAVLAKGKADSAVAAQAERNARVQSCVSLQSDGLEAEDQDQVKLLPNRVGLAIVIRHYRGAGEATLKLECEKWPGYVRLVFLDFKDLEGLELTNGKSHIEGHAQSKSKSFMRHSKPKFKLERFSDRVIVELPDNFLNNRERSLTIKWEEYYRQ